MLRLVIQCDAPGCKSPLWSTEGFAHGQGLATFQTLQKDLAASGWIVQAPSEASSSALVSHLCPDHAPQPNSEDR